MSDFWLGFVICGLLCSPFLTYLGLFQWHKYKLKKEMEKIRPGPEAEIVLDEETAAVIAEAEAAIQSQTG